MITVVLTEGPPEISGQRQVVPGTGPEKVAVAYYGRHEHFEATGLTREVEGQVLPVYRWAYSTAIAE
ncbi:DUF5988 family protein [Streptomyces sp. NPDC001719]